MILAAVTLALLPWGGPSPATVTPQAAKYKLVVHAAPFQRVQLQALDVARGWVAAFCTSRLCSPFHYTLQVDRRGSGWVEFEVIRDDPAAAHRTRVRLRARGAAHEIVFGVGYPP